MRQFWAFKRFLAESAQCYRFTVLAMPMSNGDMAVDIINAGRRYLGLRDKIVFGIRNFGLTTCGFQILARLSPRIYYANDRTGGVNNQPSSPIAALNQSLDAAVDRLSTSATYSPLENVGHRLCVVSHRFERYVRGSNKRRLGEMIVFMKRQELIRNVYALPGR